MKRLSLTALTIAALFALAGPASAQQSMRLTGTLDGLNDSGATATTTLALDGTQLTVTVQGSGFTPNAPHAQHIHGELGQPSRCPTPDADTDGDGFISVAEGIPFYGGIQQSLTTEGDTGADSALAVDRFPTADAAGNLNYSRTFDVPADIADDLPNLHVVVHGIDINDSGTYDGDKPSELDPSLPFEATVPAVCGTLAASPSGNIDTGHGGTATSDAATPSPLSIAAIVGVASLGAVGRLRLRHSDASEQQS